MENIASMQVGKENEIDLGEGFYLGRLATRTTLCNETDCEEQAEFYVYQDTDDVTDEWHGCLEHAQKMLVSA